MYKLFINRLQVGSYKTMKRMARAIALFSSSNGYCKKTMLEARWEGNSFFISFR